MLVVSSGLSIGDLFRNEGKGEIQDLNILSYGGRGTRTTWEVNGNNVGNVETEY